MQLFFVFSGYTIFGDWMYPYHNLIKKRIKNGELVGYSFYDDYKNIGECMVLYFNTHPFERPIRPHRYQEYFQIIKEWEVQK